jgi:hypothetical protein
MRGGVTMSRPAASGTLIGHLRSVTRPAHDRLEGGRSLLDELGVDAYRAILSRLHGFWNGWQPWIAALLNDQALTELRRRFICSWPVSATFDRLGLGYQFGIMPFNCRATASRS